MHAATWRCPAGYPADPSGLASGAAGAVTSRHSSHRRRPDRCSRLAAHARPGHGRRRPGLVPELQPVCCCAASGPSSLPSLTGPRDRAAHSVTARGVDCAGVLPPASLPFRRPPGARLGLGVGPPTSVATAGASRLARSERRSPLVSHPARQVSSSRRLGFEHPERTFSKATPTRKRPVSHSFFALLVHTRVYSS